MAAPIPPGWYQHPREPANVRRYWDGVRWTEHARQLPPPPPPVPPDRAEVRRRTRRQLAVVAALVLALVAAVVAFERFRETPDLAAERACSELRSSLRWMADYDVPVPDITDVLVDMDRVADMGKQSRNKRIAGPAAALERANWAEDADARGRAALSMLKGCNSLDL